MTLPKLNQNQLLESKVLRHLPNAINAYFDYKESEACFELHGIISKFISGICKQYDEVIIGLVSEKIDGKSIEDWTSWYVEIFKIIQTATLARLSDHIAQQESLTISIRNRIPCQTAQKYKRIIGKCYRDAYDEYIFITSQEPNSRKHQKKRRSRGFAAYNFEFIPCGCGS